MLAVIAFLFIVFLILVGSEYLYRRRILHGELSRKFAHMVIATFVAFLPWLVSWKAIQLIGIAMVLVMLLNRSLRIFHFPGNIRHSTYGEVFMALAITTTALITNVKAFYAIAILHVALADGFAAIIGTKYGQAWRYKVFSQTKTVIGSMTFWIISLCILGGGLLAAHNEVSLDHYSTVLIILPPILTLIENIAVFGTDNLAIPIAVVIGLQLAQK